MLMKVHNQDFADPEQFPMHYKNKIKDMERLENDGIIEPVQFADWAAPIVPVMKPDGTVPYVESTKSPSTE